MVYNKPMAYPTLTTLKTILKITDASADVGLQLSLDSAISWVEEYTGRSWSGTPITVTDEEYDLDSLTQTTDGSFIMLRNMDIASVTAVKLGTQTQDSTGYKWDKSGRLVVFGRIFDVARRAYNDFQYITVSYTYGATLPKSVEGAIVMLALAYWNDQLAMKVTTSDTGLGSDASANTTKSERIGEYQKTTGGGNSSASNNAGNLGSDGTTGSTGTINSISRLLAAYRKRRI